MQANKELQLGYYWVKHNGEWRIAQYFDGYWGFPAIETIFYTEEFEEINYSPINAHPLDQTKTKDVLQKHLGNTIAKVANGKRDDAATLAAMEEYADAKIHLLQQEYDRILAFSEDQAVKINEMRQHRDNLQGQVEKMQQEYDKLKGERNKWFEIAGRLDAEFNTLGLSHVALKEKAEKMADSLSYAMQTIRFADQFLTVPEQYSESWGNDYMNTIASIEEALSSYNSQTNNRNENNG